MNRSISKFFVVSALSLSACGNESIFKQRTQALSAYCTVDVIGKGTKQVETDYLPHVVACENGSAGTEALKAQAVAARSYMYYSINNSGSICDGQGCQVYTCARSPEQKHYDAVNATSGQVLMYSNVVIAAFYVAGAIPSTASCQALSSDSDPTKTEKYITYNYGKTGAQVTQTTLGWVNPSNSYNRGCKSQNGAHCLSQKGKLYPEILGFYYGADIQLITTTGSCVNPQPACGDGTCDVTETCSSCAQDCGPCASCGNGTCDVEETCSSCEQDCGPCASCGDGTCDSDETCSSCEEDCGPCALCGNETCDETETCSSCEEDCGPCALCGNETCDETETCSSCEEDCGPCSEVCGDGTCGSSETCQTCPQDCKQGCGTIEERYLVGGCNIGSSSTINILVLCFLSCWFAFCRLNRIRGNNR